MRGTTFAGRPAEPDWDTITDDELAAYRDAENRFRASGAARAALGEPAPGVTIDWEQVALPGRDLPVRVYRPSTGGPGDGRDGAARPLVVHVHGGAFVGTAPQSDWINSHLAADLPALVVSVEHRLLAPDTPLSAAVDDGWDVLRHLVGDAARWGADPARVALLGESCGGLISAIAALRARDAGLALRAQVLVNPATDLSGTMFDYDSFSRFPQAPTLPLGVLRLFQRLATPPGADPRALSPMYADDLAGLAPALVVIPTDDPLADQGRRYADRLRKAGTSTLVTEYAGAGHAFLSLPGLMPQAHAARTDITAFLRDALA
ncbi:alpha/beta hydrolase [Actinomadura logoneensis]|uniref:Alpha/beta hydrolase n=1 Tax=Actinomadura logoneensis TaxID=2293572 RepID=A0A372JEY2_9ACTN|nr:alpha/beta hydrolase [Actinomadura logoneensis]RFU38366.1 alpha/beta hydrolase [Actinomadura logoneensis]